MKLKYLFSKLAALTALLAIGHACYSAPAITMAKPVPAVQYQRGTVNSKIVVWVNLKSGIYHYPGTRWYGHTLYGKYMPEGDAIKDGYRAARNGQ